MRSHPHGHELLTLSMTALYTAFMALTTASRTPAKPVTDAVFDAVPDRQHGVLDTIHDAAHGIRHCIPDRLHHGFDRIDRCPNHAGYSFCFCHGNQ